MTGNQTPLTARLSPDNNATRPIAVRRLEQKRPIAGVGGQRGSVIRAAAMTRSAAP
jgi:hypothetical protein